MSQLAELTSPDAGRALPGSILLLPCGSVEPHGPHLPLDTDTILANETARRAAAKLEAAGMRAVVAPAIPFAVTDFSRGFPGRVSMPAAAVVLYISSALEALAASAPARILLVTLHFEPAHLDTLRQAAAAARTKVNLPIALVEFTKRRAAERIGGEFATGSCHAGEFETSLVLAARPELVRKAEQSALPDKFVALPELMKSGAATFAECGMSDAYCGFPARASVAEGERLYELLSSMVVEAATAPA